MAKVTIKKESFTPQGATTPVAFERVIVTSEKDPETFITLRLSANDLALVRAILKQDAQK